MEVVLFPRAGRQHARRGLSVADGHEPQKRGDPAGTPLTDSGRRRPSLWSRASGLRPGSGFRGYLARVRVLAGDSGAELGAEAFDLLVGAVPFGDDRREDQGGEETVPLNAWRVTMFVRSVWSWKGPVVRPEARIASVEMARAHGAAPARSKRNEAQIRKGKTRKSRDELAELVARKVAARVHAVSAAASAQTRGPTPGGHRAHRTTSRNGVTTSTPMASPVHHTDQVDQKSLPGRARTGRVCRCRWSR